MKIFETPVITLSSISPLSGGYESNNFFPVDPYAEEDANVIGIIKLN